MKVRLYQFSRVCLRPAVGALRGAVLAFFACLVLISGSSARAATLYWDTNGATAGSGAATGMWDAGVSSLWTTDSTGASAATTATTTTSDDLTFSAGSNGSTGTVTVSGTQSANTLTLNQAGLTFTGGTISLAGATGLTVNSSATINSSLSVKGISFATAGQTLKLGGGAAIFVTSGNTASGSTNPIGLTSTLELTAGSYAAGGNPSTFNLGDTSGSGSGGLVIDAGATLNAGGTLQAGLNSGGVGLITLNGGTVNQTLSATVLGRNGGNGRLIINGGNYNHSSVTSMIVAFKNTGATSTTTGRLDVNGGALTVAADLVLNAPNAAANGGTATVNLAGGVTTVGTLAFGQAASFTGAANAGSGTLTMTGGSLYVDTGGIVNYGTGTYAYAINLSGGTVGAKGDWSSSLNMALGTTNGSVTFKAADVGNTARNITLAGALSGGGGFIKSGGGTLFLNGGKSFTGDVYLNAGTLSTNSAFVADAASLYLTTGGTLNLNFSGSDSISKLFIDGVQQNSGTYDSTTLAAFITGTGSLAVTSAVPEPSAYAALAGVIALGLAAWRRSRA